MTAYQSWMPFNECDPVPSFADDVLRKKRRSIIHQCVADGQTVPLSLFRWCIAFGLQIEALKTEGVSCQRHLLTRL
ncbi:hypothetical protein [Klebsiella pneumoniae]|uniref:hypothetical protein n=1 Tax=Klebsiella pneumoniae TaxID=573 RepID=UPI001F3F2EBA